jgi:hypothetical protein
LSEGSVRRRSTGESKAPAGCVRGSRVRTLRSLSASGSGSTVVVTVMELVMESVRAGGAEVEVLDAEAAGAGVADAGMVVGGGAACWPRAEAAQSSREERSAAGRVGIVRALAIGALARMRPGAAARQAKFGIELNYSMD